MSPVEESETMTVRFRLNGEPVEADAAIDASLTRILRDDLERTDTKIGCEAGRCGACMVLMNGEAINSCLVMAWQAEGADVVTGRGLDALPVTAIVRDSLAEESAFQCGYCAPGFVVSLVALFTEQADATDDDIVTALEGNICRCTGYHSILRGARLAARKLRSRQGESDDNPD